MTWYAMRLPWAATRPRAPKAIGDYVRVRYAVLLGAWAFVTFHWLAWPAVPFQALIAGAVLFQAIRRERLLSVVELERSHLAEMELQLRQAEDQYRALVETLPLATYIDAPDGEAGVSWVSPQITALTSYAPEEWVADPLLHRKVLHPEDAGRVSAAIQAAKDAGSEVDHEYRLVRRDGSVVWVHDTAVTVDVAEGRLTRGFIVDVTARRQAELELESQNERLRELDRLKDEFVALVSHELRTPLTSIRGYLELMSEDDGLSGEQTHFLSTIDRNAQRLQRVVGDLLFCAQVEAGHLSLEEGLVDVNEVIREAIDAGRPAATRKEIELVVQLADFDEVAGDRARLAQVFDNFISNAIKFTPSGGTVTVTTSATDNELEIAFADTGMGIPASELPRLFERFFRTEHATAAAVPGTGLGLAIAKAIVEGHGGRIGVESEDGAGTTFRVFLPR